MDLTEQTICMLPELLQNYCVCAFKEAANPATSADNIAAILTPQLNMSTLSMIIPAHSGSFRLIPALVRETHIIIPSMVAGFAMESWPDSALLRSWHQVLQDATSQPQSDHAAMLAALQPFVPADSSSAADCACLRYYAGDQPLTTRHALLYLGDIQGLNDLSEIWKMDPTDVISLA